ncbi:MAG: hypothetical protein OEY44_03920 [Candidatus Peregrinibacteria bacterium]|nr:hypothetical protein [Candidatus Peregrinibacteria bacterium]
MNPILLMGGYFGDLSVELQEAFEYLEEHGLRHPDMHGGNLLLSFDGDCYIIDLGVDSEDFNS